VISHHHTGQVNVKRRLIIPGQQEGILLGIVARSLEIAPLAIGKGDLVLCVRRADDGPM
jgi:hypothetical protein